MLSNRQHAIVIQLLQNQAARTRLEVVDEINDRDNDGVIYAMADLDEDNAMLWAELNGVEK